ncbi:Ubiquinone/menaquinone biosynthesis C-methyltransferase UbiE [Diplonema papillatum]|nr:Ubiquinone/menaquinone biosynthesis C-methyltransferase UbiE [Diplonema papillatum]
MACFRTWARVGALVSPLPPPSLDSCLNNRVRTDEQQNQQKPGEEEAGTGRNPARPPTQQMSSAQWDDVAAEYAARVEAFTALFVDEMLEPFTAPARLLDVGCGAGAAARRAAERGFEVSACDASRKMVELLGERVPGVACVVADGASLPAEWSTRFSYAISNFSVIFFASPAAGLREIRRCLADGGVAVVSAWGTPAETPAFRVFPDAIKSVLPERDLQPGRIAGSVEALGDLLREARFERIKIVGPVQKRLRVGSAEAFYERFALGSAPTKALLATLGDAERRVLKEKVMQLATERGGQPDGSIDLPASAYFAYGTKV